MHTIKLSKAAVVWVIIGIGFWAVPPAFAHRVNVFAWVEGDTIHVESKFSGGRPAKSGKVVVTDPRGRELLSGLTNDAGAFSFRIPQRTDLKIVLIAGQGHQGEWTIRAAEMADLPSGETSDAGPKTAGSAEGQKPVSQTAAPGMTDTLAVDMNPGQLEAVIASVLDRKLKPITRMLADMQQEGPRVSDIFAGLGYILGLVGIAAYVQSRKKKEL